MNVIFQYLGYGFRLLAVILGVYLSLIALDLAHHLYGIWGYVVGILLLPLTVPAALLYQGFIDSTWFNFLELVIVLPLLWLAGSVLICKGRKA